MVQISAAPPAWSDNVHD